MKTLKRCPIVLLGVYLLVVLAHAQNGPAPKTITYVNYVNRAVCQGIEKIIPFADGECQQRILVTTASTDPTLTLATFTVTYMDSSGDGHTQTQTAPFASGSATTTFTGVDDVTIIGWTVTAQ